MRRSINTNQLDRETSLKGALNGIELSIQEHRPSNKEPSYKSIVEKSLFKRLIPNYAIAHVLIAVESIDPNAFDHEESINSIWSLQYNANGIQCRLNVSSEKEGV